MSDWQPIETAPKNPPGEIVGPDILLATEHHGIRMVVRARYVAGYQNRWMDTDGASSVTACEGDGSLWAPWPEHPVEL